MIQEMILSLPGQPGNQSSRERGLEGYDDAYYDPFPSAVPAVLGFEFL